MTRFQTPSPSSEVTIGQLPSDGYSLVTIRPFSTSSNSAMLAVFEEDSDVTNVLFAHHFALRPSLRMDHGRILRVLQRRRGLADTDHRQFNLLPLGLGVFPHAGREHR